MSGGWCEIDVEETSKVTRMKILHDMLGGVMESVVEANNKIDELEGELGELEFRFEKFKVFLFVFVFVLAVFLFLLMLIISAK